MKFSPEYFIKAPFTPSEVKAFFENAQRDLMIAKTDRISEVKFTFAYQALLKAAIALIAKNKHRLRSVPGHHIKALEALAASLRDPSILTLGNAMRTKRNTDLYGVRAVITDKEAGDYLQFVEKTIEACGRLIR
jgi:hypothetical protein